MSGAMDEWEGVEGSYQLSVPDSEDTTYTKVFVGGLPWETDSDGLREHFDQYGDIVEAAVIRDRASNRSKGYGFVTFCEIGAAQAAVTNGNPIIGGRKANCNLAAFGKKKSDGKGDGKKKGSRGKGKGGQGKYSNANFSASFKEVQDKQSYPMYSMPMQYYTYPQQMIYQQVPYQPQMGYQQSYQQGYYVQMAPGYQQVAMPTMVQEGGSPDQQGYYSPTSPQQGQYQQFPVQMMPYSMPFGGQAGQVEGVSAVSGPTVIETLESLDSTSAEGLDDLLTEKEQNEQYEQGSCNDSEYSSSTRKSSIS